MKFSINFIYIFHWMYWNQSHAFSFELFLRASYLFDLLDVDEDNVLEVVNLFEIYAGIYSCTYDEVYSMKGSEIKKKWKEKTKNKESTFWRLGTLTGSPQLTLFS